MDLQPDTTYEVRLTIEDPDGVEGEAVQIVTQSTRSDFRGGSGNEWIFTMQIRE